MKSSYWFVGIACLIAKCPDAALGQASGLPFISEVFPPAQDIRQPDRTLPDPATGPVAVVSYNAAGRFLATAGSDLVIRLWNVRPGEQGTGELLNSFAGHTNRILAISAGLATNSLVSVGADGVVKTWDEATGKAIHSTRIQFEGPITLAAVRPGRDPVVAMASGSHVRLWNYENLEPVKDLDRGTAPVSSLGFGPDGSVLIAGTTEGGVEIWNAGGGELTAQSNVVSPARTVCASATHVAVGCADGLVRYWKLDDASGMRSFEAKQGAIRALAFSPRGDQLASGGTDGTVKVWDVATGALLCSQDGHTGEVLSVAFSSNGQKMASGGEDGTARCWTVPLPPIPSDLLTAIKAALPAKATATPKKARRLLVFWRADAILHKAGVPAANHAIELMGKQTGAYEADFSRDYRVFDPSVLDDYDAIVMNSTAHLVMPDRAREAYLEFVKRGRGVIGIHAAMDTFRDWPEGAAVIGATFGNHPWGPSGTWAVKLEEPEHPLLRVWGGKNFKIRDEFYEMWDPFTRADRRVLLSVDMSDETTANVRGLRRPDRDFALSWIKLHGEGRVFYCVFGHIGEPFQRGDVLQYYLDGIQYALGDLAADASPGRARR